MRELLGSNDLFIDIGANIGFFTIIAGRQGASIHAFEPDPLNCHRLKRNLKLNGFPDRQVIVHPCALGGKTGSITLHRPESENYGMSSIVDTSSPDSFQVPLERLDDILTVTAQRTVIKIDVEGAELLVLDGAKASLEKMSEDSLWLVEVHTSLGVKVPEVAARFQEFGYDIAFFDDETGKIVQQPKPGADVLLVASRPPIAK